MICHKEKKYHPLPCSRDLIASVVTDSFDNWKHLKVNVTKLKEAAGLWKSIQKSLLNIFSPNNTSVIFTASTNAEKLDIEIQNFYNRTVSALE